MALKHIPFYGSLMGRDLGERKASTGHVLVYGAVEAHSMGPKGCIASNAAIAEDAGMELGSVKNIISRLASAGWVRVVLNDKRQRVSIIPMLSIASPLSDGGRNPVVTGASSSGEHRIQLETSTLTGTGATRLGDREQLLALVNSCAGRKFRTLPLRGAGKVLELFTLTEIEQALNALALDPWHKERLSELSIEYLLRATTIDRFIRVPRPVVERGEPQEISWGKLDLPEDELRA